MRLILDSDRTERCLMKLLTCPLPPILFPRNGYLKKFRRRKWQPTPLFLPGESQGWGSLVGCLLWVHTRVGHDRSDLAAAAGSFTSLELTQMCSFLWLSNIPFYICTTTSLSVRLSSRLLPCPSYCKQQQDYFYLAYHLGFYFIFQ